MIIFTIIFIIIFMIIIRWFDDLMFIDDLVDDEI